MDKKLVLFFSIFIYLVFPIVSSIAQAFNFTDSILKINETKPYSIYSAFLAPLLILMLKKIKMKNVFISSKNKCI